MGDLNKKIDKLTKIVILLLLIVFIQLLFNGFMVFRDFQVEKVGNKLVEETTNSEQVPLNNAENL